MPRGHYKHQDGFCKFKATLDVTGIEPANLIHDDTPIERVYHFSYADIDIEDDLIRCINMKPTPKRRFQYS